MKYVSHGSAIWKEHHLQYIKSHEDVSEIEFDKKEHTLTLAPSKAAHFCLLYHTNFLQNPSGIPPNTFHTPMLQSFSRLPLELSSKGLLLKLCQNLRMIIGCLMMCIIFWTCHWIWCCFTTLKNNKQVKQQALRRAMPIDINALRSDRCGPWILGVDGSIFQRHRIFLMINLNIQGTKIKILMGFCLSSTCERELFGNESGSVPSYDSGSLNKSFRA